MAQQINLFNPALKPKRSPLNFQMAATGWAAALVLVAGAAGWIGFGNKSLQAQQSALSANVEVARAELARLGAQAQARNRDPQVAEELARLESQVRDRNEVMDYLKAGELGDTRGFSEHFRALARQSFDGMWLTALHIASSGNDMTVEGRALRAEYVPGYLKRLNGEQVMQGHPFSALEIRQPAREPGEGANAPGYVEFRIATRALDKNDNGGVQR